MPRTTNSKTKDELLVENAILKYNEQVRMMLKQELAPFSESIKQLDKRISEVEDEVFELKDVIQPFSAIRKKLWFIIIAASISIGILGDQISKIITSLLNK